MKNFKLKEGSGTDKDRYCQSEGVEGPWSQTDLADPPTFSFSFSFPGNFNNSDPVAQPNHSKVDTC